MSQLLFLDDVARLLNVHKRTVVAYVKAGTLPKPRKIGAKRVWRAEDLNQFFAAV